MIGIYKITNAIDGKIYIGQTNNNKYRWYCHIRELKQNKHNNNHLQYAWNKYGESNFNFEMIEILTNDRQKLNDRETFWLNYYIKKIGRKNMYNLGPTGNINTMSEESRKKLSEKLKLYCKNNPEKIRKRNSGHIPYNKGKKGLYKATKETKDKISKEFLGRIWVNDGENDYLIKKKNMKPNYRYGRLLKLGKKIKYDGKEYFKRDFASMLGITYKALCRRLERNMSIEEIVNHKNNYVL